MPRLKNKTLFAVPTAIFIYLCLVPLFRKIEVGQDLLSGTLTMVVQTFVSLMALLGMVGIFKLELLNNKIDHLAESARGLIIHFRGLPGQYLLPEEIFREGEKIIKENHSASAGEMRQLKRVVGNLQNLSNTANDIKIWVLDFIIFSSAAIGASLVCLATTPMISNLHLGVPVLFAAVVLSVIALLSAIGLIQSML